MKTPVISFGGLLLASGLLASCAVGPDFQRPMAPSARSYGTVAESQSTVMTQALSGKAQHFTPGGDIPAQWWTLFQSPPLNALIEQAFAANPTIEVAQAALRQAQENVYAQQGYFFPTILASYSPSRTKLAGNVGGNSPGIQGDGDVIATTANTPASKGGSTPFNGPVLYNFHTAQLTVGFVPDVFGANARQVESLQAQADAQRFAMEATYITLASNVAAAAIQEAALRAQIAAVARIIEANTRSLDILRRQLKAGYVSALDVATQDAALAQTEQMLPALRRQLEQTRDLLRVLVGKTPDQELAASFDLDALHLPETLPLSLPSQLVQQRPDVRAAEEQLHYASAQVGVAVANRLPQLSLSANLGGEAAHFNQVFRDSGKFFNVVGNISQPIFDGGTLRHRQRAAEQALIQAGAQYRSTVLGAFQNVADTLHALQADAQSLQAASRAEQAAGKSLHLIRKQHEHGYVNTLVLLNAEQTYQQAMLGMIQARATRLGDTAALFQALGGGWWNKSDTTAVASMQSKLKDSE